MKKNVKKTVVVLVGAAVLLFLAVTVFLRAAKSGGQETVEAVKTEKIYKVSVIEVSPTGNDVYMNYTGIIQAGEMEQAAFSTVGTVKKIYVSEGDEVKAGDLLAELDDTDARRQVENAQNNLQIANTNLHTTINQRQNAYDAFVEASSPDEAKKNLDSAVERRDSQQQKVDGLSAEIVGAEERQELTKTEYEQAGKDYTQAQNDVTSLTAQLAVLKETPGVTQEEIDAKQTELDAAVSDKDNKEAVYNEKRTAYSTAQVDSRTKQTELDAARATLTTYNEAVDTAQQAYDNKVSDGENSVEAKAQRERFDAADASLYTAQAAYDSAQNNYEAALEGLEDCKLYASKDGYVLTVTATEGSMTLPIAPAVVIGSRENVVTFGVSQSDIRRLSVGQSAQVTVNGKEFAGEVKKVGLIPDETSRTYATEVSIAAEDAQFYLGELATVKIAVGEQKGVWLPLSVILNDGEDYVYMAENGRAKRQNVVIREISNDMVMVTGIETGGMVISEGMKLIKTGSLVSIE
ncbi:MAG: biotin/lipoyl-binding protein [Alistipes sp.]|nr:biotin/lipoyl-binding protein [Alistipes sp.]